MKKTYHNEVTERLKLHLEELLDEYGIVDISVGAEKYFMVSRERLLHAVRDICLKPHRYLHRYHMDGKWIAVLSAFGPRATRAGLDQRFDYI